MSALRLALCQYGVEAVPTLSAWQAKLARLVAAAAAEGARLLVFPEYAALELAAALPAGARDLAAELGALQDHLGAYRAAHAALARRHGVYILAGSFPVLDADGRYRNRAYFFGPDGAEGHQDKLIMTRFERESWGISAGHGITLFQTALGPLAVLICYDIEFPLPARAAVAAGAALILVPSCTDTRHGHHRVHIGARARALEGQCLVATAPLVGAAPWSAAIDVNVGAAGVFAPADAGFPADGMLAKGEADRPGWVHASVDLAAIDRARREGQVLNHRDWDAQGAAGTVVARRL